jgi:hypothetical protein
MQQNFMFGKAGNFLTNRVGVIFFFFFNRHYNPQFGFGLLSCR